jgi:ADP-ribose pyrophosphatase YjhB (NUDIX family)
MRGCFSSFPTTLFDEERRLIDAFCASTSVPQSDFVFKEKMMSKSSLPKPPTKRPNLTIVPAWQARPLLAKGKNFGWQLTEEGWVNPGYGSFRHFAVVEADGQGNPTALKYDLILWDDGPIDPETGLATPGTVIVPIEKKDDMLFVRCFWEWRPAIWDQATGLQGNWVLSVPGGFASFVGESAETAAKREALEEGAIHLFEVKILGHSSANRANTRTCVNFGYALFEVKEGATPTEAEGKLLGNFSVPLADFPTTLDKLVNEAVGETRKALGLVQAKPRKNILAKVIGELESLLED